jgi:hypothetical protein
MNEAVAKLTTGKTRKANLDMLLLDWSALTDSEVEVKGKERFVELFLQNARYGYANAHDGEQVRFNRGRFSHAFYLAGNWRSSKKKTGIDVRRVERIKWVLPVIQGRVTKAECWLVPEDGIVKRLYIVWEKGYIVWIEPSTSGWWFSTAYSASSKEIRGYIRDGTLLCRLV